MRIVLRAPRSFTPASRICEPLADASSPTLAGLGHRKVVPKISHLRHAQTRIAAGIDRVEWREIHVDVECHAVVRAPPHDADTERGNLGALDVDTGSAGPALRARSKKIDDGLFEQLHEALHLDAATREIDQRVDHDLTGAVVRGVAAAVGLDDRDGALHLRQRSALSDGVHRCVLEEPQLVRRVLDTLLRKSAHREPGRLVLDAAESFDDDVVDESHSTMTTAGWSHSSW